ncbi:MAG: DUF86 domain-containing protein [Chloroflexota bacterium]|nr:DUF86 domain-containing protein [Chloroflexota bacterium]
MTHPTSPKLLSDVLRFADSIKRSTAGKTLDDYRHDELLRAGVERWFENIGEALRRLERKDAATFAMIPAAREMIDFRNLLAHGYDMVRDDQVWHYVKTDLPALRTAVAAILDSIEG